MRIIVKVKTCSQEEKVERISQPSLGFGDARGDKVIYKVSVKEAPVDGKANKAVTQALAMYFDVQVSRIHLISGHTFKQKVFEID
ncbi:MAG: DUF167 domain-containing protein [Patescibacteria group bacterium]